MECKYFKIMDLGDMIGKLIYYDFFFFEFFSLFLIVIMENSLNKMNYNLKK